MDTNLKTKFPPKCVRVNLQNQIAVHNVKKKELNSENIYNKLSKYPKADPNLNYNIIHEEIMRAKDKHMPTKNVKFNRYKHKYSTWITQGLIKSIKYRDSLYKQLNI